MEPVVETNTNGSTISDSSTRVEAWVLAIVCLGIIAYGYAFSKDVLDNPAYLFGENLVVGFLIWAFFRAGFGRKQNKIDAVVSFLLIFGSLLVGGVTGHAQYKREAYKLVSEIQQDYSSMVSSGADAHGFPQRIEKILETTPVAKGEIEEVRRFMKTVVNQAASQHNDYLLELAAIEWEKLLDAERLKNDKTLIESKMMVRKAKGIVGNYRAGMQTFFVNARKEIDSLNVSESLKRELAKGFDTGNAKLPTEVDTLWDMEAGAIAQSESIVALLSSRKGAWEVRNGQILFASARDRNKFNSYVAAIENLTIKYDVMQKQRVATMPGKLNGPKNSIN